MNCTNPKCSKEILVIHKTKTAICYECDMEKRIAERKEIQQQEQEQLDNLVTSIGY